MNLLHHLKSKCVSISGVTAICGGVLMCVLMCVCALVCLSLSTYICRHVYVCVFVCLPAHVHAQVNTHLHVSVCLSSLLHLSVSVLCVYILAVQAFMPLLYVSKPACLSLCPSICVRDSACAYMCVCLCVFPPDTYENGDEHGADRIRDHQVVLLHQEGRDDDADASQRISDNVKENS